VDQDLQNKQGPGFIADKDISHKKTKMEFYMLVCSNDDTNDDTECSIYLTMDAVLTGFSKIKKPHDHYYLAMVSNGFTFKCDSDWHCGEFGNKLFSGNVQELIQFINVMAELKEQQQHAHNLHGGLKGS
jgi:hypothetical protein